MRNMQDMTPREIDARIAEEVLAVHWATDTEQRLTTAFDKGRINPGDEDRKRRQLTEARRQIREHSAIIDAYDDEFIRRGGWNRVFVVVDGHVHSSTVCRNGYFATTDWRWLPDWSNHDWDEIMADAGERMCSWCFPDAPTEYRERKSRMEHPTEAERREAREKREAERQAKADAADAKKVYDADGNQVRKYSSDNRPGELIKTDRTCGQEITECLFWAKIDRVWSTDPGNSTEKTDRMIRNAEHREAHAWYLAQALARWNVRHGKKITDAAELYETHRKKANKK